MSTPDQVLQSEEGEEKTPFQSPVPYIVMLRNFIFGKEKPDVLTQVNFFINLFISLSFFIWHILSWLAISKRELIWQKKGISVEGLIESRGVELGFGSGELLSRLLTLHGISVICWGVILLGLVRLYRRKADFIYIVIPSLFFYVGMYLFYLSFRFFIEDTTAYDKLSMILVLLSATIEFVLLKRRQGGSGFSFFGVDADV